RAESPRLTSEERADLRGSLEGQVQEVPGAFTRVDPHFAPHVVLRPHTEPRLGDDEGHEVFTRSSTNWMAWSTRSGSSAWMPCPLRVVTIWIPLRERRNHSSCSARHTSWPRRVPLTVGELSSDCMLVITAIGMSGSGRNPSRLPLA